MEGLGSLPRPSSSISALQSPTIKPKNSKIDISPPSSSSSTSHLSKNGCCRRREWILVASPLLSSAFLPLIPNPHHSILTARADEDEFQKDEDRIVRIFQETSPSVVFIQDLEILSNPKKGSSQVASDEDENTRVEGTGSGFLWDNDGHIVTNYHVISKLAIDTRGLQRCKVFLVDTDGNTISKEGKLIGFDPAYDLAVLKVDVDGKKLKPALIGTSRDLRVGQSCFAIGNPFGYEHTLTTGVVSGLGREIPSPNGRSIRGAIQTDAAINAGNSGGPLIDSYGHVIGVNTATFTRKGTGVSSGVNFAIPIDTVVQSVPYLIVYGTLSNSCRVWDTWA